MHENIFHRAVYLTGPTASGKTAVGVALARRLDAEVLALDSMTLYRGMDIATAKPTLAERGGIAHHLIDVIDPWEAGERRARIAAGRPRPPAPSSAEASRVLFVGGTPLYLKALLRGLFQGPGADRELRRRLEHEADAPWRGRPPSATGSTRPQDRRPAPSQRPPRLVRALEVIELAGQPALEPSGRARSPRARRRAGLGPRPTSRGLA